MAETAPADSGEVAGKVAKIVPTADIAPATDSSTDVASSTDAASITDVASDAPAPRLDVTAKALGDGQALPPASSAPSAVPTSAEPGEALRASGVMRDSKRTPLEDLQSRLKAVFSPKDGSPADDAREAPKGAASNGLEGVVNVAENTFSLDLDGDGDVGQQGHQQQPNGLFRAMTGSAAAPVAAPSQEAQMSRYDA